MSSSTSTSKTKNAKSILPAIPVKTATFIAEPSSAETVSVDKTDSMETILLKRKAEKMSSQATTSSVVDDNTPVEVAKLNVLEARMKQVKDTGELPITFPANSFTTPVSSPQKVLPQKTTNVQINEWYVEDELPGHKTTVCATVCNVYGLKDELLGFKPLPNGDMFYWPSRIFYPNQVSNIMNAANVTTGSEFLKTGYGKPLIIFSRLSETFPDPILKFDEVVSYLKEFIHGRSDEASIGNPKKTFSITVQAKPLNEIQIDALVAISAKIFPLS